MIYQGDNVPISTICFIFLKIDITEKMTDGGQEKIHEALHLIFINQRLSPAELAKNIFLFEMKEIRW